MGYSDKELNSVPARANLGLGCGNPLALAALEPGQTVVDLGCGAGFDCFLAADRVGETGRVIGVDMTPEMIERARDNARAAGLGQVEFRLGEIENLPVADGVADVVVSNCVVNLAPDKRRVFQEAFRVLVPGGRLWISDIVLLGGLPERMRASVAAYISCVAGALQKNAYLNLVGEAGFVEIEVMKARQFPMSLGLSDPPGVAREEKQPLSSREWDKVQRLLQSVTVRAFKPNNIE